MANPTDNAAELLGNPETFDADRKAREIVDAGHGWNEATAAIAQALCEAERRGMMQAVKYCHAKGKTFSEMQSNAHANPLYERGDMILVWVNEGDIIEHGEAIERAAKEG